MSGHSHFATIKRAKEAKDAQKGKIFSKHAKAISMAVKAGGGVDPASNYKLRMAIEAARADNLPKENIDRSISKASSEAQNLEEYSYEGFGPYGISTIVEAATDNKNRTAQELKNVFEKSGGNMGGPGSVSYNFENKGMIRVNKSQDLDSQILDLIDLGIDDYEEVGNELILYVPSDKTAELKEAVEGKKYIVNSMRLVKIPKNLMEIDDLEKGKKVISFIETLEDHEDVQNVYTNADINDELMDKIQNLG